MSQQEQIDFAHLYKEQKEELSLIQEQLAHIQSTVTEIRSLVGPFGLSLPDGMVLVQSLYSIKYIIDPTDLIIAPNLIIYRQWEDDVSSVLSNAVTTDTVFVDVGANFGYITCLMASRIGNQGQGRVFAIEPNPKMLQLLYKNTAINWSMAPIAISGCAVGREAGEAKFVVPLNRASNASFVGASEADSVSDATVLNVKVKRLDDIIPDDVLVDIVKIDVEGHEFLALCGAEKTIRRSPSVKIVMEWSPEQMATAGYTIPQLWNLFQQLDLNVYPMANGLSIDGIPPIDESTLSGIGYANVVLARRD